MIIYPPYTKWKTVIKDPLVFQQFLWDNTDFENTGRYAKYQGKLSKDGFILTRNINYGNSNRPQIRGKIVLKTSGEHKLSLQIQSQKIILYSMLIFSTLIALTGIIQQKPFALVAILFVNGWIYLLGWIFHTVELKKTKVEVVRILEIAQGQTV